MLLLWAHVYTNTFKILNIYQLCVDTNPSNQKMFVASLFYKKNYFKYPTEQ